jgi:Protein of unknown function (DUF2946)
MDDIVKQAMAKWPDVPACYGWLGLDARGNWYMRDEQVQRNGPFTISKGSRLTHDKLIGFIERNYQADASGQWYFQNGPQCVYVELEVAPWVWRIQPDGSIQSHTQTAARMQRCFVDERGHLYLDTEIGFGIVHSQDMVQAVTPIDQGLWVPQEIDSNQIAQRFGFVKSPALANATREKT